MNSPQHKQLVLASTSRYRAALLAQLQQEFSQQAPVCDETPLSDESPANLVLRLSEAKAQSLVKDLPHSLIIGSDQVADLNGEILGKPGDIRTAHGQLERMSGHKVIFRTGLCVLDSDSGRCKVKRVDVEACFRELNSSEISRYLELEQPLDCAGSFRSEGLGVALLSSMACDDPSAVIGLPLIQLASMLRDMGMQVP